MPIIDLEKPILVYLANGAQGGAVVRACLRRGLKARALVRDAARAQRWAAQGVDIAMGDLCDPQSLIRAGEGVAHAVLQIPIGSAEAMRAQLCHALAAAATCGLQSLVLKLANASRSEPCPEPSFVAAAMIEDLVRGAGLPFSIVRPTLYLDNLLKASARREIVAHGTFSPPIAAAQQIAWTSADDCAEAALTLLTRGAYGGDHCIAGRESVTGDELAARIGTALGRPIAYRAQPLDEFERDVDSAMGPGTGRRVASKFRFFASHPDEANTMLARSFAGGTGLEGFRPTSIEDWVGRHRLAFTEAAAEG